MHRRRKTIVRFFLVCEPYNHHEVMATNVLGCTKSRQRGLLAAALAAVLVLVTPFMARGQNQHSPKPTGAEPLPEPAIPAILAAFDKYEVVAMPEAHGLKDLDDFILTLIRTPAFTAKVNDIEVECGNSLFQPVLDRYIAGEDVPFRDVRKVWRNTSQDMCGTSMFFQAFFPVVRAINQRVPQDKRIRVWAGDPPVDWDEVKSLKDTRKLSRRDATAASVLEKEVLSKHRKALMLFGTYHLLHGVGDDAVSIIETDHPGVVFVISDLGIFGSNFQTLSSSSFVSWPVPSLARTKGTWLGAMDLGQFLPKQIFFQGCDFRFDFPKEYQKPVAELVDAFLYLGPPDLRLQEQWPIDLAFDDEYRKELARRDLLTGLVEGTNWSHGFEQDAAARGAENPFIAPFKPPDLKSMTKRCLEGKNPLPAMP
jgi:hypothetical protein